MAHVTARSTHVVRPVEVARRVQYCDEDVPVAGAGKRELAGTWVEFTCARKTARGVDGPVGPHGQSVAVVIVRSPHADYPEEAARGVELRNEDVLEPHAGQNIAGIWIRIEGIEVGRLRIRTDRVHTGVRPDSNVDAVHVPPRSPHADGPVEVSLGVELRDEEVLLAGTCEKIPIVSIGVQHVEVDRIAKYTSDVDIPVGVQGKLVANNAAAYTHLARPAEVACRVELGNEDAGPGAKIDGIVAGVEIHRAPEPARGVDAAAVGRHGNAFTRRS